MSRLENDDFRHVRFLLGELESELQALANADEAVQALTQLDAREAAGEPLEAVCGKTLRATLQAKVAGSAVTAGLARLADLKAAMSATQASPALPAPAPAPVSADIIDLGDRRAAKAAARRSPRRLGMRQFGHAIAVSLALTAIMAAGVSSVPGLTRLPIIDLAAGPPAEATQRLAGMVDF